MQGIPRKIVYLSLYEGIAIALSTVFLSLVTHQETSTTGVVAVCASLVALAWNFVYNCLFEAWEARYSKGGRGFWLRVAHTCGFEGGMLLLLAPLMAFGLQVSAAQALGLQLGMLTFFLLYSFVFTLGFDRVFGLPASALRSPDVQV
ncbi:MAG: PACE efflux transporter [Candidatus Eremiobacteraeota bacterium]|nr:PACE efflux transporter [Candidatus Eremiobacteraeota bacterium]MCW5868580.1 PACE efflux transporter [Candidatus Eremiobacteraeota bacterium]